MHPTVTLHRATADDAAAVSPLLDAYRRFYGKPGDVPAAAKWLSERLRRQEAVVFAAMAAGAGAGSGAGARAGAGAGAGALSGPALCAARADGTPVGFALLYPTFTTVALGGRFTLNDLFVDPAARRLGVGRALVERCMAHAREAGAASMQLLTEHTNAPAQALYERLGWSRDQQYQRWTWTVG